MSKSGKVIGLPIINARAPGIDIGSRIQVAAIPPELSDNPVGTFLNELVPHRAKEKARCQGSAERLAEKRV